MLKTAYTILVAITVAPCTKASCGRELKCKKSVGVETMDTSHARAWLLWRCMYGMTITISESLLK